MVAYSGPTRTLPGSFHAVPEGTMCDSHPARRAITRIQGPTDAYGATYVDGCMECRERLLLLYKNTVFPGRCSLCGLFKENVKKRRDPNEGILGPTYDICEDCVDEHSAYMVRDTAEGLAPETHEAAQEREEIANMALAHFDHEGEDGDTPDAAELIDDEDLDALDVPDDPLDPNLDDSPVP